MNSLTRIAGGIPEDLYESNNNRSAMKSTSTAPSHLPRRNPLCQACRATSSDRSQERRTPSPLMNYIRCVGSLSQSVNITDYPREPLSPHIDTVTVFPTRETRSDASSATELHTEDTKDYRLNENHSHAADLPLIECTRV